MKNPFEILTEFLNRGEIEVEGRALESPPEAIQAKLRDFARGRLPAADRQELIGQLNQNRVWIALLAAEVKALRHSHGTISTDAAPGTAP